MTYTEVRSSLHRPKLWYTDLNGRCEKCLPDLRRACFRWRFAGDTALGYVIDLPVSSEISVKGSKSIWGMPKHQANLDFVVDDQRVSSQYDLDGRLAVRIDVDRPKRRAFPLTMGAANYCQFRGMLMKSSAHFDGNPLFSMFGGARATLTIGDHPRVAKLRELAISEKPIFTAFYPVFNGVLDDHQEAWFLLFGQAPSEAPEGLESVADLGLSEEWFEPPDRRE